MMNSFEKEEIVNEVLIQLNEMDKEDRKTKNAINRMLMKDVNDYFKMKWREFESNHSHSNTQSVCGPCLWHAYWELRKMIPWIISVRYSNDNNWDAFYKNSPNAEIREQHATISNQMLPEDKELATQIGKDLVDVLFKYLEPSGWDEVEAGKNRSKIKRSPFAKVPHK